MEKSKHLQDQLKELKTEIESLKLEEQQQQASLFNLRSEARGYIQEPVYIPHSNVGAAALIPLILTYRVCSPPDQPCLSCSAEELGVHVPDGLFRRSVTTAATHPRQGAPAALSLCLVEFSLVPSFFFLSLISLKLTDRSIKVQMFAFKRFQISWQPLAC